MNLSEYLLSRPESYIIFVLFVTTIVSQWLSYRKERKARRARILRLYHQLEVKDKEIKALRAELREMAKMVTNDVELRRQLEDTESKLLAKTKIIKNLNAFIERNSPEQPTA